MCITYICAHGIRVYTTERYTDILNLDIKVVKVNTSKSCHKYHHSLKPFLVLDVEKKESVKSVSVR